MIKGNSSGNAPTDDVSKDLQKHINSLNSLAEYSVRELVEHAEKFGIALRQQRLETNQIRKFLDALNQLKAQLVSSNFEAIETEVVLLKPKLAYAATRQNAVEPLQRVMSAAIDKTHNTKDFERLVQLIESIIAYHKAAGGK